MAAHATTRRRNVLLTLLLAISAAVAFAMFDVLVQSWAPAWGAGRLLPIVYWMVSILSFALYPVVQFEKLGEPAARRLLIPGTLLVALQAICIVFTLASFGDAARVNVVYAMRAMWGVILAWLVAVAWGGNEATLPRQVMTARLLGAGLLTISVILVVVAG